MGTITPIHDGMLGDPTDGPGASTVGADAERVVALAWQDALERGHAHFGTGHVLLGIVHAEGPEAGLLAAVGVTPTTAGAAMALVASSSVSEPVVTDAGGPPAPGAAVADLLEAAGRLTPGPVIRVTHLLAVLLATPWGQSAEMLAALGVDTAKVAEALAALDAKRPSPRPRRPRDPSSLLYRPAV